MHKLNITFYEGSDSMKNCPYCGYSNYDRATACRKCDTPFVAQPSTVYQARKYWIGPQRAQVWRGRALSVIVLGLLIKVYWGGYGPWPIIDYPILATLRTYLEPILLFGGVLLYLFGWLASAI